MFYLPQDGHNCSYCRATIAFYKCRLQGQGLHLSFFGQMEGWGHGIQRRIASPRLALPHLFICIRWAFWTLQDEYGQVGNFSDADQELSSFFSPRRGEEDVGVLCAR